MSGHKTKSWQCNIYIVVERQSGHHAFKQTDPVIGKHPTAGDGKMLINPSFIDLIDELRSLRTARQQRLSFLFIMLQ
jgi:hypothetical protein